MRLRDQYRRLYDFLQDREQQPGLPALADALHCSERNMRILLAKMQQQGWLAWQAARGRGHLSQLNLLKTPDSLALDHLSVLLAKGELEQAFASLEDAQKMQLAARLPEYLGIADDACKRLRMPLFRKVDSFDPLHAIARLESHLIRQVFSRLTTFDHETLSLRPGLAHHWEQEKNATVWHFWLRSGLSFHDGSELTVEDVRATFLRLRDQPARYQSLYQNILRIEVGASQRISFYLNVPDYLWPHCVATANASIVPRKRKSDFAQFPIGCGAFKLVRNNQYQITLRAFKDYYRERPLLDEIDMWMLTPPSGPIGFDLQFGYSADQEDAQARQTTQESVMGSETGCTYLICNPQRTCFKTVEQRLALADYLAPETLFARDDPSRSAAAGLLAIWKHRVAKPRKPFQSIDLAPLRRGSKIRMISGQTVEMMTLAQAVKSRLQQAGIKVEWRSLPFSELIARAWMKDTDLLVTREVMHDDQDFGCFEWFASDSVFRYWMPADSIAALDQELLNIKAQADSTKRMQAYAKIGKQLVKKGWLIPISHENQHVSVAPHVAGVRMTPFGFVAFNELWLREPRS